MNSIDFETLLIIIFVLVDDWYESEGKFLKANLSGSKPDMSDSEVLTMALMMDYLPFPGETQFLGFIRANYGKWFPDLLEPSQFNRRWRKLSHLLERLRRSWLRQLGAENADIKPIYIYFETFSSSDNYFRYWGLECDSSDASSANFPDKPLGRFGYLRTELGVNLYRQIE